MQQAKENSGNSIENDPLWLKDRGMYVLLQGCFEEYTRVFLKGIWVFFGCVGFFGGERVFLGVQGWCFVIRQAKKF